MKMIRRTLKAALPVARYVYRKAPLASSHKKTVKSFFMRKFAFLLADTGIYHRWKAYEELRVVKENVPKRIEPTTEAKIISEADLVPRLPIADGYWEWSDHQTVRKRILEIEQLRRQAFRPSPLSLIKVEEALPQLANRIRIPVAQKNPDVSIIIPVFNQLKLTLECLLSISTHLSSQVSVEIIVADDASTDETANILRHLPNIQVKTNERNLGFLRNCNGALKVARGRFVLFLNNDVQVTQGWLESLVETFKQHDQVGAVGPRILYPSGHLQEAGVAMRHDGMADMVGLGEDPGQARYKYSRRVDYCSGACLMVRTDLLKQVGGFSDEYAPSYCEDADLCLKIRSLGYYVYYNPESTIIHHLSKTTSTVNNDFKLRCVTANLVKLTDRWQEEISRNSSVRPIAFYLPQFHPIPENDFWWGKGFTEWTNVCKARPNFLGHHQPRVPADLGYYDLRVAEIMDQQAEMARRFGIYGFCFYYYWFGGKRLLEMPIERMLKTGKPDMPFCLCWANENWTRRWDGRDKEILVAQAYSESDERAVINDLIRYFRDNRYIRIDGRPLLLVYRVDLLPDFRATAELWREECRKEGVGEIYIAMVESFGLVHAGFHPRKFGCDAAVEFPPQGLAEQKQPSGKIINPHFKATVADYRDLAVCYATREIPDYTRFRGIMPGWDNTARRQNDGFSFEHATPGAFQAWAESIIRSTRLQQFGDERLVFINAWNEWAEGAYLEPDSRFGYTYLEALQNALDSEKLLGASLHSLG